MPTQKTEKSFPRQVWENLSAINVNEKAEKKLGLTYLSWAWGWAVLMENYPESSYEFAPEKYFQDGTCEVGVTVTVKDGENEISRYMWLPVLDHKNKPIPNPNAFDINKNKMRCLVKCLGMFGLGLYIYAGEDLPEAEKNPPFSFAEYERAVANTQTEEELKQIFADAWKHTDGSQRAKVKDIYENRKADFQNNKQEQEQNAE